MVPRVCYFGPPVPTASPLHEATAATVAAPALGRRAVFVDVLRLVASVQMVMGHTIDGLLLDALREGAVYDNWRWVRGLTSVAFMLAAGMSYHLTTLARFERHKSDPSNARRRLRRGVELIALGYLLHLPLGAFSSDPNVALAAWQGFAIADVLQCIGLSILMLEAMTIFARRPAQVAIACALGATAFFALAPMADAVDPSGPWRPLLSYLTHRGGSLFPLFPWCGYVLAGVAAAYLIAPERPDGVAWRALVATLGATALAVAVSMSELSLADTATGYSARPAVATIKVAAVLALVAALAFATQHFTRLPRVLQVLAGESLAIYVSHLLVLYGAGIGVTALVGHTLSLPAALAVGLAMVLGAALAALGWHRIKAAHKERRWVTR